MSSKTNPKLYLARGGRNGQDETNALDLGMAIIGFEEVPSLAGAKEYDAVFAVVHKALPNIKPRAVTNYAGQLWAFALAMETGDLVVLPQKLTSQVAIGRVTGPYAYREVNGAKRHTRPVEWLRPDVARSVFGQDLLYSFGAFMTVCNIARNDAVRRVQAVLAGKPDPGFVVEPGKKSKSVDEEPEPDDGTLDLGQAAHDQIVAHIQSRFSGHALAQLVDAVLNAEGWITKLSPPGPDGGVDILAGRGTLGLDGPRLCVQVKSQTSPVDVTVYRTLQGGHADL